MAEPADSMGKISKFSGLDIEFAVLAALDAATALIDLSPLRSVGLQRAEYFCKQTCLGIACAFWADFTNFKRKERYFCRNGPQVRPVFRK